MDEPITEYKPPEDKSSNSLIKIVFTLVIALAIPITVTVFQQRADLRQRAAENPTITTQQTVHNLTLEGYVYEDANANSKRDSEEPGIKNMTVQIVERSQSENGKAPLADQVLATVTTDTFGYFTATVQSAGIETKTFVTRLMLPPGFKTTTQNPLEIKQANNVPMEFGIVAVVAPTPIQTSAVKATSSAIPQGLPRR